MASDVPSQPQEWTDKPWQKSASGETKVWLSRLLTTSRFYSFGQLKKALSNRRVLIDGTIEATVPRLFWIGSRNRSLRGFVWGTVCDSKI